MPRFSKTCEMPVSGLRLLGRRGKDPGLEEVLAELREAGVDIIDVKVNMGGSMWRGMTAVYTLVYEAEAPIDGEQNRTGSARARAPRGVNR